MSGRSLAIFYDQTEEISKQIRGGFSQWIPGTISKWIHEAILDISGRDFWTN